MSYSLIGLRALNLHSLSAIGGGISLGRAVEKLNDLAQKILPSGVNCELQGEAKQFILSMRNLAVFIIVIMFLIYVVF